MNKSGASQGQSASELISKRIAELGDWRGETLGRMRQLIKEADPDVVEEWKWMGTPVWSHDGIICTGESYKTVVKLTFAKGASLKDPARLFNSSLDGTVRNLRFTKSITSAGFAAAGSDPGFLEAYVHGTANYVPFVPNTARTTGFVSLFTVHAASQYEVEYDAEYLRYREFSTLPSRLSAVYAFGREDSRKAHELYRWDLSTLRRFRLVRHPLTRVHRANMQIVSLMRSVYPRASWQS